MAWEKVNVTGYQTKRHPLKASLRRGYNILAIGRPVSKLFKIEKYKSVLLEINKEEKLLKMILLENHQGGENEFLIKENKISHYINAGRALRKHNVKDELFVLNQYEADTNQNFILFKIRLEENKNDN